MSEWLLAEARYPLWRNLLVPVFVRDQLTVLVLLGGLCAGAALLAHDLVLFLFLVAFAYAAYVASMQKFLPYELRLPARDLGGAVDLLDKTPVLARAGDEWIWKRRSASPGWLRSELDTISILDANGGYAVHGRKDDLRTLARVLNARRSTGAGD